MMLDLTQEETEALAILLCRKIDDDRYPLSPRIQTLKTILAKIRREPAREPLPPPKVYAPPRATLANGEIFAGMRGALPPAPATPVIERTLETEFAWLKFMATALWREIRATPGMGAAKICSW
jgi:hypothetical protein